MNSHRLRILALPLLIILAMLIASCTRSASTPPPTQGVGGTPVAQTGQQATMEAVRAALLTQTAQAANAGADYTATPTVVDATETPVLVPTQEGSTATPSGENLTPTEASGATIEYIVQHGDWLYSIAYNFNVDPEDIIQLNNLQAPYELDTGQVLLIPTEGSSGASPTNTALAGGTEYTVLAGEWVYSIARKFGVEPQAIIDLNGLVYPFTLYPGDVIKIP